MELEYDPDDGVGREGEMEEKDDGGGVRSR